MVYAPALADLDSEREVVLEEIAMVEDTPQDLVHDLLGSAIFGDHALGGPCSVGRGRSRALTRRSVGPITGRGTWVTTWWWLPPETSTTNGSSTCPRMPRRRRRYPPASHGPGCCSSRHRRRAPCSTTRTPSSTTYVSAPRDRPRRDRRVQPVLDSILGGSASSRLFQEIREKRGLAYTCTHSRPLCRDRGARDLRRDARGQPGACLEIVAQEIDDIAAGGVRDDELRRAKENIKGRIMLSMESTSSRVTGLASR